MGTFGELVLVGLRDALRDESIVVIDLDNENLFQGVVELLPDVVVVDRDLDVSEDLVDKITSAFPSMKVLDCSVENTTMRVYAVPPGRVVRVRARPRPLHSGRPHVTAVPPTTAYRPTEEE